MSNDPNHLMKKRISLTKQTKYQVAVKKSYESDAELDEFSEFSIDYSKDKLNGIFSHAYLKLMNIQRIFLKVKGRKFKKLSKIIESSKRYCFLEINSIHYSEYSNMKKLKKIRKILEIIKTTKDIIRFYLRLEESL